MSENKSFDELLLPVRNDIDRIDKELLKLFTERMQCAERVAEIKRKAGTVSYTHLTLPTICSV